MTNPATIEAELEQVFTGMFSSLSAIDLAAYESVAQQPLMVRAAAMAREGKSEQFHFALIHPLNRFIDGLLGAHVPDSHQARFILRNRQFVRQHIGTVIEQAEGFACRGDKTRTVIDALMRFYLTGARIEYDWTQKYTFHLPHTVFTTHDETVEFLEAIEHLHSGKPARYFNAMVKIMQRPKVVAPIECGEHTVGDIVADRRGSDSSDLRPTDQP